MGPAPARGHRAAPWRRGAGRATIRSAHVLPATLPQPAAAAVAPGEPGGRPAARLGRRLALDTLYLLLALPAGVVTFTVVVAGWSLGLGLLITLVGLPVILATIVVSRWMADVERRRAALVLGAPVQGLYRPLEGGFLQRLRAGLGDRQTFKDLVWHLLLLGIGIADFTIAVTAWATTLGLLTAPAWWWSIAENTGVLDFGLFHVHDWGTAFLAMGLGLVALPVAAALVRGTALGSALLGRALLGADRAALEARVSRLAETREGAVSAAAGELERLERDLHDGAQARLVAVAMELGMAEEQLAETGGDDVARERVTAARDETRRALAELRDLARGMRPGLLAERGLEEALRSLAARSPVPVVVRVELPARPPATVDPRPTSSPPRRWPTPASTPGRPARRSR